MNIEDLTIKGIRQISQFINFDTNKDRELNGTHTLNEMIGKKVIVRTYSAGVWFGVLAEKSGNEVILKNARRMYRWWARESISLSACAIYGVKNDKSKIVEAVDSVWLEAIEIIPCNDVAIKSLEGADNVKAG